MKNLLALKPYFFRYKQMYLEGFFFIILTNIFGVISPKFIGNAIDAMSRSFQLREIILNVGLYVLFAVLSGFFLFLVRQRVIVASRHIEFDLKNDYYNHLQQLPRRFYDHTGTGEIISRGTNDLNAVREFLGPGVMYSFTTFFRLIFAVAAMVSLSPILTLFALLPAPILSYSVYKIGRSMQKQSKSIQESYAGITNLVQENLSGIKIVKSYTREAAEIKRFETVNRQYYRKNLVLGKLQALFFAFLTTLSALSLIPVIWIGGINVMNGTMTVGDITQFIVYVSMLSWPIISIGWVTSIVQKAAASQARLTEILDASTTISDENPPPDPAPQQANLSDGLSLRKISFHYPNQPDNEVLNNISLDIAPGSKVAFVGATGSGKTTLVNLLPRLYDPTKGKVLLDGVDIRTLSLETLREEIGFVPQANFLFSDTIAHNIDYGNRNPEPEQIIEASRIAMLYDDVQDFPDKFDTMLGEKGINLSGGQKQRACIARALARKPKVLILDDALSAVDTATEARIFEAMLRSLPETTIILISHRISTVKNCDRIFVLDKGTIAESGTHEELITQESLYAELYNHQLLEDEILSLS
ncbi:MAG: ABC transporter ATP-binding protein [Chlorobiaceae bacterium]|jgi:ATP-binding cassette, subfamily B, multidrug efflux pump|nr:ABC transporter ATP-binding protein [Chlorobiaceae bacterium]